MGLWQNEECRHDVWVTFEWRPCLHLLIPRWGFFDRLGLCPRLEVLSGLGQWEPIFPPNGELATRDRGLEIFLLSQIETLVERAQAAQPHQLSRMASTQWILSWVQGHFSDLDPQRVRVLVRRKMLEGPGVRQGSQFEEWAVALELPC